MRKQYLENPFEPVTLDEDVLDWRTHQSVMEWMLEKSGAGMVRLDYEAIDWWYKFSGGWFSRFIRAQLENSAARRYFLFISVSVKPVCPIGSQLGSQPGSQIKSQRLLKFGHHLFPEQLHRPHNL